MFKRSLCAAAVMPAVLALGGCSTLGIDFTKQDSIQYETSHSRVNLQVPPEMAPVPVNDRFDVPTRPGMASANAEKRRLQAMQQVSADKGAVVQRTKVAQLMRDGSERWLRVDEDAEQLWPVVQDFWSQMGLSIAKQDAATGYIETGWAENKAKLPQDIIRGTIGKVLDFAYSTGERDQYRCRLERNKDGSTDIFIAHRSMVEVVTGAQKDSTMWQPGPTDPMLEAQMLKRLAVTIDSEFNPEETKLKTADVAVKDVTPAAPLSTPVTDADGKMAAIVIDQPFDRAWRTVGVVLDRMGFEQADRDRAAGYYLVRYLDPQYEAEQQSKRGFFTRMFNKDAAVQAPTYRIRLADEGSTTRLVVLGEDGNPDTTGVASNILTLLAEQMR